MKAIIFAVVVIIVVVGLFVFLVRRDPNRVQTQQAFDILKEASNGVPQDSLALGYLNLKNRHPDGPDQFDRQYSTDMAMQRITEMKKVFASAQLLIVEGTILKQEYQLRQSEFKLAQLRRVGGDITQEELEKNRLAYVDATKKFQTFWDREN